MSTILARTTSRYGAVYFAARRSSTERSSPVRSMVKGLLFGMHASLPLGKHAAGEPAKPALYTPSYLWAAVLSRSRITDHRTTERDYETYSAWLRTLETQLVGGAKSA